MPASASILFENARVITCNPHQPRAEALAVTGNKIIFLGSNQEAKALRQPGTRVIDAGGCTVLPGFIDAHYHLWMGAAELEVADLNPVSNLSELSQALLQHAKNFPLASWVTGAHLAYNLLPGGERLSREYLDAIIPNRPIALMAYDYHTLWANTPALVQAGLLHPIDTDQDPGITLGSDGLPNGELREPGAYGQVLQLTGAWGRAASGLIDQALPTQSPAELVEDINLLKGGLALAARYGITSLHNMDGGYNQLAFFASLEELGELTCRVYVPLSISPKNSPQDLQEASAMRSDFQGRLAHGGFVKFFMDGVLESWTAFLLEPYADSPDNLGSALYTQQQFNEMAVTADRMGLQICVHAIGDAAVRRTLNGFEAARLKNGPRDSRHRIEHIELVHPADLPRFAQLGVIASMQPLHLPDSEDHLWRLRAGKARWKYAFAWQSLRQANARLAFGSDWPIVPPGPLPALQTALSRCPWQPGDPDQAQTLMDVIDSYTYQAAYAEFQEDKKGQLKVNTLADLVLLSADLEAVSPEEIGNIDCQMTVCDGRIVYEA